MPQAAAAHLLGHLTVALRPVKRVNGARSGASTVSFAIIREALWVATAISARSPGPNRSGSPPARRTSSERTATRPPVRREQHGVAEDRPLLTVCVDVQLVPGGVCDAGRGRFRVGEVEAGCGHGGSSGRGDGSSLTYPAATPPGRRG